MDLQIVLGKVTAASNLQFKQHQKSAHIKEHFYPFVE